MCTTCTNRLIPNWQSNSLTFICAKRLIEPLDVALMSFYLIAFPFPSVIRTISAMDKEKTQESPQQQQQNTDTTTTTTTTKNGSGASDEFQDEFYNTGRIGRRNAMPDILGNNSTASSGADLPLKLSALTTNGNFTSVINSPYQLIRTISF